MHKLQGLTLINYLNHSHLDISFTDGVNIIAGKSGVGKSSIRSAIEDLFFNEDIKNPIKEGEKRYQIIGKFEGGIEVEKVRSATINRYILRKPNQEEQVFDKIGKDIPNEIKEIFGIDYYECDGEKLNLNVARQIGLPFLLDKTPSFRMKLFNQLTGNSFVDKLLSEYNKDIFNINKDLKVHEKTLEQYQKSLEEKEKNFKILDEKYGQIQSKYVILLERVKRYEQLLSISNKIKELKEKKDFCIYKLNKIKIPKDLDTKGLREKIEKYNKLKTLLNALQSTNSKLDIARAKLIKQVQPELNRIKIQAKIDSYEMLKTVYNKINTLKQQIEEKREKLSKIKQDLIQKQKEFEELKKSMPICDKCGQYIINCEE